MYPLPQRIMDAFEHASALVVEVDIRKTNQSSTMALLGEMGFYHDGSSLQTHLSASQYQRLAEKVEQFGLPLDAIKVQKPWLAVLSLSAISVKDQGFSEHFGVDQYFLNRAANKRVIEIESIEKQLRLMNGFSDKEQSWMLDQSLNELDQADVELKAMVGNWKTGDEKRFEQQITKGFPKDKISQSIYNAVFIDRNKTMASNIVRMAVAEPGIYFVVVGAGHMIGPEGIPTLLKNKGYVVNRY